MENRLTYKELLQELKDNRDKKTVEYGDGYEIISYKDLGQAFFNYLDDIIITWKGVEYYESDIPEDIEEKIMDELFEKWGQ